MTESPAGTTVGAARPGGPTSTAPTPLATVPRSLAHPSTDPRSLVARVQTALGWQGSDFLVGLQGYDELMATLETAHDLEGSSASATPPRRTCACCARSTPRAAASRSPG